MQRALVDPQNPWWRNVLGSLAALVIVPVAIVAVLMSLPFRRPKKRTSREVAQYLRSFIDGTGSDGDWDYFISVPIADPGLDDIRLRAGSVELPVSDEGRAVLVGLLAEAESAAAD